MVDIKYKMNWVPQAKELRDRLTAKENVGIASKIDEDTDDDFYQNMYEALSTYFSDDEEANKVLIPEEVDRDSVSSEVLKSYDDIMRYYGKTGMLSREAVDVEVDKILGDPRLLEIPTKTFDDTEEALSVKEVSDIASEAIDAVEEEPTNAQDISDPDDADGGAASKKEFDDTVKSFIEVNEGNENEPYKDSRGNWTVGIGHYIGKTLPERFKNADGTPKILTDTQVQMLFEKDYKEHKEDASNLPMYDSLDNKGKQALIDLTFNMGSEVFNENKWPKFFAALENKDLKTAAKELKNSKWYNQVKSRAPKVINLIKGATFN